MTPTQLDAIEQMVAIGYGLITVGNGRMVMYGRNPPTHVPGMAFIDNRIKGPEAVAYIREAIEALQNDARKAKTPKPKKAEEIIVPTEE